MSRSKQYQSIPTNLTETEFEEFVLPHLTSGCVVPASAREKDNKDLVKYFPS